jgi:Tautomerase enzyme
MPFVRIDLIQGKSAQYRKTLGEIDYRAMVDLINVPNDDKFQVITEHAAQDFNVAEGAAAGRRDQPGRGRQGELVVRRRHRAIRALTTPAPALPI